MVILSINFTLNSHIIRFIGTKALCLVSYEGRVKCLLLVIMDNTVLLYSSLAVTGDAFHY